MKTNFQRQSRAVTLYLFAKIYPSATLGHSFPISTIIASLKKISYKMLPAESKNNALMDGQTYRQTDGWTLERNFLNIRSTSYGVYISQLIRNARASSYITDFNTCNKLLTQKLLKQGYRYHKLHKTFSKFYRRYYDLISKFQNSKLDINLSCAKDFRNLNSIVIWSIN